MIAATVLLGALVGLQFWATRALLSGFRSIAQALNAYERGVDAAWVAETEGHLARLDGLVDMLPAKWADMEEKVRASEDRTRSRIRRAVQSIEDGDQTGWDRLAREADKAGLGDGEGSGGGPVQPMPTHVAPPPPIDPEDESTWLALANARKFGV